MPNCPECSALYKPEDRYCPQCGQRILPGGTAHGMNTQQWMDVADVQRKLGMVYFKKGEYLRAVEIWERVSRDRPDDCDLKALIQDAKSRHEESEAHP